MYRIRYFTCKARKRHPLFVTSPPPAGQRALQCDTAGQHWCQKHAGALPMPARLPQHTCSHPCPTPTWAATLLSHNHVRSTTTRSPALLLEQHDQPPAVALSALVHKNIDTMLLMCAWTLYLHSQLRDTHVSPHATNRQGECTSCPCTAGVRCSNCLVCWQQNPYQTTCSTRRPKQTAARSTIDASTQRLPHSTNTALS